MQVTLSPEWARFVSDQVAGGRFPSAELVVQASLKQLQESVQRQKAQAELIREKVRQGLDELDRGDFEEFDEAGNTEFFAELMAGIKNHPNKNPQ